MAMARVPPFLLAVWSRAAEATQRFASALRDPRRVVRAATRRARAARAENLPSEFEAAPRSPWLARGELFALVVLSWIAALNRGPASHAGPLAGFVVLAVALLTLATFRRGNGILPRRALFAAVLLLVPHTGHVLPVAASLATSLAFFSGIDALANLRGLPGLAPRVLLPARALRAAPWIYAGFVATCTLWTLRTDQPGHAATSLLACCIALAMLAGFAFSVYLAHARALELGAAPRAWGAAFCFVPSAVFAAFAVITARTSALAAIATAFVVASTLASTLAVNFDALRGARRARRALTLAVFGTPACLFLALLAADEPVHRSAVSTVAFVLGVALSAWHRELAEVVGSGRSPWSRFLSEARGVSERRHPFDAVARALERMQHAPMLDRSPALIVFESNERLAVDRAGYVRRRPAAFPRELLPLALAEPFATVREEVLHAVEVRRPDVRGLLAWLDADDLLAACVGIADGEPVCALLLPRAKRVTPLSLDELFEAKRLADVLAGHLAILEERRQSGALVDRLEKRLADDADVALRAAHQASRRGHARRLVTERVARTAMSVPVAPKTRLLHEALERAAARGQGAFVVTVPGNDALGPIARAHLQSPRADEAFVVVDGTEPQPLELWQDALRSPLLAADRGTLVLQDVRCVPLAVQRFIAHVHAERRLPGHQAEPLALTLVLTARELPSRLIETGELAPELLERLAMGEPLRVPDMTERGEDLRALLLKKLAHEGMRAYGRPIGIADAAYALLVERMLPAGELDLDALVVALCRVAPGGVVQVEDLRSLRTLCSWPEALDPEEAPRSRGAKKSSRPAAKKSVAPIQRRSRR